MVMNSMSALTTAVSANNDPPSVGNTSTLSSSKQLAHNKNSVSSLPHQQSCTSEKYAIQSAQVEERWITADPTDVDTQQMVEALHTQRMKGATTPLLVAQGQRHREALDRKRENYLRRPLLQQAAAASQSSSSSTPPPNTRRLLPTTANNNNNNKYATTSDYNNNNSSYGDGNNSSVSSSVPIRAMTPDPAIEDMFPAMTVSNDQTSRVVLTSSPSSRAGLPPVGRGTVSVVAQRKVTTGKQKQPSSVLMNKSTPVNTTPGSHDAYSTALRAGTPQPKSNSTLGMRRRNNPTQSQKQQGVPPPRAVSADCGFGLLHCRGIPPEMLDPSRRIKA